MKFFIKLALIMLVFFIIVFVTPTYCAFAADTPTVKDRYPEEDETDVPVDSSITVTFSVEMDEDDVENEDYFKVEDDDGREVDGRIRYDEDTMQATFEPDDPLEYNTKYRVELSRSIRSEDRVRLDTRYRWYFYTEKQAEIFVDGIEITGERIIVNKSPVNIRVESKNATKVIYTEDDKKLSKKGRSFYLDGLKLEPGDNDISFEIYYQGDPDDDSYTFDKTINLINVSETGASVTIDLNKDDSFSLFNNRLKLNFPGGCYLKEWGTFSKSQTVAIQTSQQNKINEAVTAGYIYNIAPLPEPDDYKGYSLQGVFDDVQSPYTVSAAGTITIPCYENLADTAFDTITVFYDPRDGVGWNWQNLGGMADRKKKTVTVPFKGFGRYVAVNKIWTFRDYNISWWARPYVEYLWAKGIMSPLPDAPTGYFGLVDAKGNERYITRGEFTAMLGKAMGLHVPDEDTAIGVFKDLYFRGGKAYTYIQGGYEYNIPRDDLKYIEAAAINGYINGFRDDRGGFVFRYYDSISREQASKIITSAAGIKVSAAADQRTILYNLARRFKDYKSISVWAQPYVLAAQGAGYYQGYSDWTFRPGGKITRAEAAKVIYTLMEKKKLIS